MNDGVTWCEQRMIDTFAAVGLTSAHVGDRRDARPLHRRRWTGLIC
ncbi:MAG: hypothetical protein R3A10_17600 [Caldilineaceae bacterium]